MSSIGQLVLLLVISGSLQTFVQTAPTRPVLRLVSWNVGDNDGMKKGNERDFYDDAMDALLGIDVAGAKVADIFVIGLQELCWNCNPEDLPKIPEAFKSRLRAHGDYVVVGLVDTLKSSECFKCKEHGTTALFVIAKRDLVKSFSPSSYDHGCSDKSPPSKEKGVAFMQLSLSTGKSVCVATSHLESRSPKYRRQCLKNFLDSARGKEWSSCDFQFISGDMNMRTAESADQDQPGTPSQARVVELKRSDELIGTPSFGGADDWTGNTLDFINSVHNKVFEESPIQFLPTYKLDRKLCKINQPPIYKKTHAMSWTDRIIHVGGSSLKYDSLDLTYSDHRPVFEEFQLS